MIGLVLASLLLWLEGRPVHREAVGSILGQDTHLGWGFNPWSGLLWEETDQRLSFSPPSFLYEINTSMAWVKDFKNLFKKEMLLYVVENTNLV